MKAMWMLTSLCVVLIVAVTALVFALIATSQSRGSCQFYHDVAEIPPAPTSSSAGLKLFADARIAYYKQGCSDGSLLPPDKRLLPYLPASER